MVFWIILGMIVALGFVCIGNEKMFSVFLFAIILIGGLSLIDGLKDMFYMRF